METEAVRPYVSAKDPNEWQAELALTEQYRGSSEWIGHFKEGNIRMHEREVQAQRRERAAREAEDAYQREHADEIRAENEAAALAILQAACPDCFCVHPGDC